MTGYGPPAVIAMMQKDEETRLEPWILYHGNLIGFFRLYIFDNGSKSKLVLDILRKYETLGVNVDYRFHSQFDYQIKGELLSEKFKELEKRSDNSIFIPLDCDEFLSVRRKDGSLSVDRLEISAHLSSLIGSEEILVAENAHANVLGYPGYFFPAYTHHKVLFAKGVCDRMDHGYHTALSRQSPHECLTDIVYLHFHHRPFDDMTRQAKMKLQELVNVDDLEALTTYSGAGAHAANMLLKTKKEYLDRFHPEGRMYLPEMISLLRYLGVAQNFFNSI